MTGPHGGVIGMDKAGIIKKFLDGLPRGRGSSGDVQMNCVLIETDDSGERNSADAYGHGRSSAAPTHRLNIGGT